jgi:hypothetical protein
MRIRPYHSETDRVALHAMYLAQGFDYVEHNWDNSEFFSRLVVEDDQGRAVMAILGRLSAEMFLLMLPDAGTPLERIRNFLALHLASEGDMASKGIQDCFAQLPDGPMMERFKTLLARLGWVRADTWENWTKPQLHQNPTLPSAFAGQKLIGTGG